MSSPKEMTKQQMNDILRPQIKLLQEYNQILSNATEMFKKTVEQGDVTFSSIEAAAKVIENCTSLDVRKIMYQIRNTLGARGKTKIKEFGAF
jgi:hypothetical protein